MSIRRETTAAPARTDTPALRRMLAGTTALTTAAVCGWLLTADPAWALPTDGTVVEGQAEIIYGTDSVTIQQGSDRVIIEWQTFDVGSHESVTFIQPHELAAALNRVLSGDASQILGSLSANGQVFISNPAGVVFGPDANVDVASIVATSLDIMNDRFMAGGRLEFDIAGDPTAVVENRGTINASGLAALVGPGARNAGAIVAEVAILGGGEGFALDYYGDGLVNFAITDPTTQLPVDYEGNPVQALVENTGSIIADGGQVILTADAAAGVIDNVINVDGIIQARTIGTREGQVVLLGGDEGTVQVAGTIDASGDDAGEAGGTVHVLGERLELNLAANIDASGPAGGGTVLVGGAERGGPLAAGGHIAYGQLEPAAGGGTQITIDTTTTYETEGHIPTADIAYVGTDVTLAADATDQGDGGTVVVWGDQEAAFHGHIRARGGVNGGNGGFAEVSSANVTVTGAFDLGAAAGQSGSVLIDPTNLCAAAAAGNCAGLGSFVDIVNTIVPTLASGTDFTLDTSNPPGGGDAGEAGNVVIVDAITVDFASNPSADNAATFSVIANAAITQNAAVTGTNGALGIDYRAVGEIVINAPVSVGGGANVVMLSQSNIRANASIQNGGAGSTSLVAGWDGTTTDINAILATVSTYGNNGGAIFIGDGSQTAGIAIGSRFGASNFAGAAMTLLGSSNPAATNGFAQAGFRADTTVAGFDINGPITIALSDGAGAPGDLTAAAGSQSISYVQVGHGGADLNADVEPDGSYTGDITILLANDLTFSAGTGGRGYAQLGHGGWGADGSHRGAITLSRVRDVTFAGGTGGDAAAQLGHGGFATDGDHGGNILITEARDLTFTGGDAFGFALLGHGGASMTGSQTGNITITRARDLTFTGNGGVSFAQLGHGGRAVEGTHSGTISIAQARDLTFTGNGGEAFAHLGHGGRRSSGNHFGAITIAQARDLTFTAGTAEDAYAQLGHGGVLAVGNHSGNITIDQAGNLTLTGGTASSAYAQVGHGDASGSANGTRQGAIDIRITGETSLVNGAANTGAWLIGHRTTTPNGISNADVSLRTGTLDFSTVASSTLFGITADANGADFAAKMIANLAGGNVTLAATNGTAGATGGMLVGSAFTYASANTLTLFSTTDIRFAAGVQNGFGAAAGQGGAVNIVAGWDGVTTDIATILASPTTYGVNGGAIFIGDGTQTAGIAVGARFGASNFAGASMTLLGSNTMVRGFAQAGFRDPGTDNFTIDGSITIALRPGAGGLGNLTATGGSQQESYVQVGHGGSDFSINLNNLDGIYAGDISVRLANDVIFTAGLGSGGRAYAQLGHGGYLADGNHSGAITITQARDLNFAAGTGVGTRNYAQIGHGGWNSDGNHSGTITVVQARDAFFVAGTGAGNYMQIGHGGDEADGNQSGAIDVTVLRNLTLTGQDADGRYTRIGHGDETVSDAGGDSGESVSGNVTVRVGGTATLTNAGIGHEIQGGGTYTSGNTFIGTGIQLTADAASRFNSAPTGELRLYVASAAADGVDQAALLNGVAHGAAQAPNNQGLFAFGAGPYDPANSIGGSAVVAGNFAYYTLDIGNAFNYIVDTPEAAAIVAALQAPGAVTLDTLQNLAQFGALPDLDGGTSFIRVDADIDYTSAQALTFQATGDVAFNADVQNAGAGNIVVNASGISVGTGRQLSTLGGIAFNAPTVNLDGNLTAALDAITGTANVVNVLSSAGGAQVQDAIDVAAAGATINIGAGTYASYIINKANLTVSGVGDGTIINTGSPAVTVVANGATVRDQVLTFAGVGTPSADDIGILLDGTAAPNLTGIQIINVDFRNLQDGIRSQGDIGDGTAAVDVTIRGNSGIDRAVFEDFVDAAIDIGDTDGDAVYLIRDLTLRDGADADAFVSGRDAIRIGSDVGAVTIHGVVMTANAGDDGIDFDGTLNNATVIIGSTTAGDANTILGQSDGIETTSINGGSFTIQGNTRIFGVGDGMDFNGTISNSALINIVDNVEISATLDAIDMTTITGSSVTIARNQLIRTSGVNSSDAIEFGLTISGNSVILIDGNTDIIGGDDGIDTDRDVVNSTFTISNNARIVGADDGIDFDGDIIGSNLTITRNQTIQGTGSESSDGIEFSDPIVSNSVVLIDNNTTILGAGDGIDFNDPVTDSRLTISNNQRIQGLGTRGDAIEFADPIGGTSVVLIDGNTALIGADDGIFLEGITGGRLTISNNALIQGGPPLAQGVDSNGIEFEAPINGTAQVAITGNTNITGALFGIDFQFAIGGTATVSIDRNGSATQGGTPYDGTAEVDLASFAVVGAITNGIRFSDIGAASGVTVSRNIISRGNADGILFRGSINSTNPTALHNNFILGHGGNGIAFQGAITSRTEVFQNFIARNGGNGILVRPTDGLSPNTLFVQVNFLPGAGFANGNGGFGYSQLGIGSPSLQGNWWGTPAPDFVASINGVAAADLPTLIVTATGDDDANVSPPFANTAFEMFAFQPAAIGVPLTASAVDILGFATDVETLRDEVRGPRSQLDRPGGAQFFTNELAEPFQTSVFTDGFSIGELEPAAGGETNGPVNLGELEPAAGPGSEQAEAEDLCVETYFGDFWNAVAACQ